MHTINRTTPWIRYKDQPTGLVTRHRNLYIPSSHVNIGLCKLFRCFNVFDHLPLLTCSSSTDSCATNLPSNLSEDYLVKQLLHR